MEYMNSMSLATLAIILMWIATLIKLDKASKRVKELEKENQELKRFK